MHTFSVPPKDLIEDSRFRVIASSREAVGSGICRRRLGHGVGSSSLQRLPVERVVSCIWQVAYRGSPSSPRMLCDLQDIQVEKPFPVPSNPLRLCRIVQKHIFMRSSPSLLTHTSSSSRQSPEKQPTCPLKEEAFRISRPLVRKTNLKKAATPVGPAAGNAALKVIRQSALHRAQHSRGSTTR